MATTALASKKAKRRVTVTPVMEKVQIWFNFLKLAYKSKDPELIAILDANKSRYEQWDDFRNTSLTQWWKQHSQLFTSQKIEILNSKNDFPSDTLVISIPFDKPKSLVASTVKRLYAKSIEERGRSQRLSQFKFSVDPKTGKEHLVYAEKMRTYLEYAKEVYVPVINSAATTTFEDLINKSVDALRKYKERRDSVKGEKRRYSRRGQSATITILNSGTKLNILEHSAIQQIKRMNMYCDNLLFNVASGEFPGIYNVKRNRPKLKVVSQKIVKVVSPKSSVSRYMQNKKQTRKWIKL